MTGRPHLRLIVTAHDDWQADAACRGTNPDLFFPEPGDSRHTTAHAKAVCHDCTVTAECLNYAVTNEIRFGVWGGLDANQRRRQRQRRGRAS